MSPILKSTLLTCSIVVQLLYILQARFDAFGRPMPESAAYNLKKRIVIGVIVFFGILAFIAVVVTVAVFAH